MGTLDILIWYCGMSMEAALIGVVFWRGIARRMPIFCFYLISGLTIDLAMLVIARRSPGHFFNSYLIESSLDVVLQFLVLLELARSVLRPLPTGISRGVLGLLVLFIAGAGELLWRFADLWARMDYSSEWHLLLRLQITAALLRILFLLILGAILQFLGNHFIPVGWGERELQVATGFGVYSLASLAAGMVYTYRVSPVWYYLMGRAVVVSFLGTLIYWLVCFVRPDRTTTADERMKAESGEESAHSALIQERVAAGEVSI